VSAEAEPLDWFTQVLLQLGSDGGDQPLGVNVEHWAVHKDMPADLFAGERDLGLAATKPEISPPLDFDTALASGDQHLRHALRSNRRPPWPAGAPERDRAAAGAARRGRGHRPAQPVPADQRLRAGLLKAVLHRDEQGRLVRRAGIMGVVLRGGPVKPGDPIRVEPPEPPHLPLDRV
jgi:hypothetical protein